MQVVDLDGRRTRDPPATTIDRFRDEPAGAAQVTLVVSRSGANELPVVQAHVRFVRPSGSLAATTMASKTGITSVVEALMTVRIRDVAVCWSSASRKLRRPVFDLLLEARVRFAQLRRHRVEPSREILQLVAGAHLDLAVRSPEPMRTAPCCRMLTGFTMRRARKRLAKTEITTPARSRNTVRRIAS
jgi:hypothetical protein